MSISVGVREACKSFPNIKLYSVDGQNLADYLKNLVNVATANGLQMDEKHTDIFKYVIYSKLDDKVRNWLGERFFSILNAKELIVLLNEYGKDAPLETYQVYCPSCLCGGKFTCSSKDCRNQAETALKEAVAGKNLTVSPTRDLTAVEVPVASQSHNVPSENALTKQNPTPDPSTPRRPFPQDYLNPKKSSNISAGRDETIAFESPNISQKWAEECRLFNLQPNANAIFKAAEKGKCFDCSQPWAFGHSCPQRKQDLQALKCMECKLPQTPGHICPIWQIRERVDFSRQEFCYDMMISAMVYECFDCKTSLQDHVCRSRPPANAELQNSDNCLFCKLPYRPRHVCMIKRTENSARDSPVRKILILTAFYGKCFDCKQEFVQSFNSKHLCPTRVEDEKNGKCPDCKQPCPNGIHTFCVVKNARSYGIEDRDRKLNAKLQKRMDSLASQSSPSAPTTLLKRSFSSSELSYHKNYSGKVKSRSSSTSSSNNKGESDKGITGHVHSPQPNWVNLPPQQSPVWGSAVNPARTLSTNSNGRAVTSSVSRPSSAAREGATDNSSGQIADSLEQPTKASSGPPPTMKLELDEFGDIRAMSPPLKLISSLERERSSSPDISLAEVVSKRAKQDIIETPPPVVQDALKLKSLLDAARESKCWDCGDHWRVRHSCSQRESDRKSGICVHCKLRLTRGDRHDCKVLEVLQESVREREELMAKQVEEEKFKMDEAKRAIEKKRREEELNVKVEYSEPVQENISEGKCSVCHEDLELNHHCFINISTDSGSDVSLTPEKDLYPRE